MSTSKIVVDADHGKLDAASKKSAAEMRKVADAAKGVGNQMDRWGTQMLGKVAGLGAILNTIRAIGQEVERQRTEAGSANKDRGGGALGRSQSIRDLGLDKTATGAAGIDAAIRHGQGSATVAESDAFLSAMASKKGTGRVSAENASRALSLFKSGLYSQEELLDAAGSGGSALATLGADQGQREARLSPEARQERALRQDERIATSTAEDALAARGTSARVLESRTKVRDATGNRFLVGLNNINNAVNPAALGGTTDQAMSELGGQQFRALQQIAENTKPSVRPNFNIAPEGRP